ncbi:hypothetical protein D3OALGA1CA_4845 [Olavius algarvensis associated proteobacterium Delta 3]|nr:hypothetical protein D3OALGA1CA_4845 [Olavius algarvensis associated proteobacterium Delta 3]
MTIALYHGNDEFDIVKLLKFCSGRRMTVPHGPSLIAEPMTGWKRV